MTGGRRSGRTLAMVRQLPDAGCVVAVPTGAMRDYVRQMIRDVRGEAVARLTRIVVIQSREDADYALTGQRFPVIFDHAFRELVLHHVWELGFKDKDWGA